MNPIRKAMELKQNVFDGTFPANCQQNSVPKELLTLVSMLIVGANINVKLTQPTLSCAQMIMSNFSPNRYVNSNSTTAPESNVTYHHSKKRETPLLLYNSLKLYGKFRSKSVIAIYFILVFVSRTIVFFLPLLKIISI